MRDLMMNHHRSGGRGLAMMAGLAAVLCAVPGAQAGFTLMANPVWISAPRENGRPFAVNDIFVTGEFGTFTEIHPDTPGDVSIHNEDLLSYRYTLDGAVVAASAETVVYSGSYEIFIVLRPFDIRIADVSGGSFLLTAEFQTPTFATLTGALMQQDGHGPGEGDIPDLSYGGYPLTFAGSYIETERGIGGLLEGEFRQEAVPAPGALGVLGLTGLWGVRRRRR